MNKFSNREKSAGLFILVDYGEDTVAFSGI